MTAPEDQNGLREALADKICDTIASNLDVRIPGRLRNHVRQALASLIAERDALSYRRRWNVEERDGDVVAICHGHHDRSDDCDWIEYVPLERALAAEAEITRLKEGMEAAVARAEKAEKLAKDETRNAEMYANAWVRELGGKLFRKAHHIDACVVTTRWMKERSDRLAVIEADQKAAALVGEYGPSNEMVRARRDLATQEHPHG